MRETPSRRSSIVLRCWSRSRYACGAAAAGAELQTVYDQLAQAAACHDEEPVAVDADQEQVRLCLLALRTDHPEYFWFDGEGTYVTTSVPVLEDSTSVTLTYTMTEEDARAQLPQVERYVEDCIASLTEAENDYQKILGSISILSGRRITCWMCRIRASFR